MNTQIDININDTEYPALIEYFFYTDEESDTGQERCNIESIKFYNNIATEMGYPILMGEDCADFIYQYYFLQYERAEEKCLKDFKQQQRLHWSRKEQ